MLFASCSLFRRSVNTIHQESSKSTFTKKDSTGHTVIDSSQLKIITGWKNITVDSGYDKVTDEVIKDYGDSVVTVRTIKEKGRKRTEQASQVFKYDSTGVIITEHSQLQELNQEDSTVAMIAVHKDVKRTSVLPWWIWLIAAIPLAACLFIWKRN